MSIDTKSKRLSILSYGNVFQNSTPSPDGTISGGDRQHLIWAYSGISWEVSGINILSITITEDGITQAFRDNNPIRSTNEFENGIDMRVKKGESPLRVSTEFENEIIIKI